MATVGTALDPAAGALVVVRIGVRLAHREALLRCNLPVPQPADVSAVLDTGSFITLIDGNIATALGVRPHGLRSFRTSSTGPSGHTAAEYEVSISLLDGDKELKFWPSVAVLETNFVAEDPMRVILGRDLLADCVLHYDGRSGFFALTV